jgi:hypothetical protein
MKDQAFSLAIKSFYRKQGLRQNYILNDKRFQYKLIDSLFLNGFKDDIFLEIVMLFKKISNFTNNFNVPYIFIP